MGYNPQESLENTINTISTLLGVHPIVPWITASGFRFENRKTIFFWNCCRDYRGACVAVWIAFFIEWSDGEAFFWTRNIKKSQACVFFFAGWIFCPKLKYNLQGWKKIRGFSMHFSGVIFLPWFSKAVLFRSLPSVAKIHRGIQSFSREKWHDHENLRGYPSNALIKGQWLLITP